MQPETPDAAAVEGLAVRLAESSGVADVRYDRLWLERVTTAVVPMRGVGLVVMAVLIVAAGLTVANVVSLAYITPGDRKSRSCSSSGPR